MAMKSDRRRKNILFHHQIVSLRKTAYNHMSIAFKKISHCFKKCKWNIELSLFQKCISSMSKDFRFLIVEKNEKVYLSDSLYRKITRSGLRSNAALFIINIAIIENAVHCHSWFSGNKDFHEFRFPNGQNCNQCLKCHKSLGLPLSL